MKFSYKVTFILLVLLTLLNIILRLQVIPREIGIDSFFVHVITNSLSEFGSVRWYLHPLSLAGLYPYSYASSVPFLLSAIHQTTNVNMNHVIFIYCILLGLLSIFTGYIMACTIINDDLYKILVAFLFSISPAIVGYSTWTITTRGLLIIMAPLLLYLLMKSRLQNQKLLTQIKYFILICVLFIFFFTTHHLVYFLLPLFFAYIIIRLIFQFKLYSLISEKYHPIIITAIFLITFSIPFVMGKFLETSRYAPLVTNYTRYIGLPIIFILGGISYLILKSKKSFAEWFILLSTILITMFIYKITYMKMFIPIIAIPVAVFGFVSMVKSLIGKPYIKAITVIFLLLSSSFVAYFQYLNIYEDPRQISDSIYDTGIWMKHNINGSSISNNELMGLRILSVAETKHFLVVSEVIDQVYGFIDANISEYRRYPISSEEFWYSGYEGPDHGSHAWGDINKLNQAPQVYNISYVVEDVELDGMVSWSPHSPMKSTLIEEINKKNGCIYDVGNIKIWDLRNY